MYTETEDQTLFSVPNVLSLSCVVIHVSLCEKSFSKVKIHNLEVMKIANLHFVSIKIMKTVIKQICPILKSMSNMN